MEINFNMTAEDYYLGWCLKNKKTKSQKGMNIVYYIAIIMFCIIAVVYFKSALYLILSVVFLIVFLLIQKNSIKKNIIRQYEMSAVLKSMHTIRTYNEGLEIINSYEKMFIPWQSIFYIENTETHLIILPTYQKGIIAVNKSNFGGEKLNSIIETVKNMTRIQEGR